MDKVIIKTVSDPDKSEAMGIEISIDEKTFFVALDQKLWPGICLGSFPERSPTDAGCPQPWRKVAIMQRPEQPKT